VRNAAVVCGLALLLARCASSTSSAERHREQASDGHRVAVAQYEIRGDVPAARISARAEALVADAARGGAELVVLPELFVLDAWPLASDASEGEITRRIARDVTPVVLDDLRGAAARHQIAVLAGSAPELRGERLYNTSRLLFPDGREVSQDKVHPTAWGERVGFTAGAGVRAFDAPWGRTAILVCYDVEFPSVTAGLVESAPEVLLVPSMTESEFGRDRVRWTAQARAVEHHAYVLVAPTVGATSHDWRHFGRAAVLTPRVPGFPGLLAEATRGGEGLVFATLELDRLRRSRATTNFFPARNERDPSTESKREPDGALAPR
jgi:predicted amidohydrolase